MCRRPCNCLVPQSSIVSGRDPVFWSALVLSHVSFSLHAPAWVSSVVVGFLSLTLGVQSPVTHLRGVVPSICVHRSQNPRAFIAARTVVTAGGARPRIRTSVTRLQEDQWLQALLLTPTGDGSPVASNE